MTVKIFNIYKITVNPIQDLPPYQFFPCYFYKREISSLYLVPVPSYGIKTKTSPQKSGFSGQILIKLRLW